MTSCAEIGAPVDAIGAGLAAAACPCAYVNQVMLPVTGYTRACTDRGGVPYAIPGLRQAVVALRNVAWWSQATRRLEDGRRFVARGDGRGTALAGLLSAGELAGQRVYVRSFAFGNRVTTSKERMTELFPPAGHSAS